MAASLLSGSISYAAKNSPTLRKVRAGDTIYSLMRNAGFSDEQRGATARANVLPSNFVLSLGDIYGVSTNSNRTELKFFDKYHDISYVFWREGATAGASKVPAYFTRKVFTAQGTVQGSILQSIVNKVGDELVAYRFLDAYVLEYNLQKTVARGAPFKITYEKLYDGQNFIRYGEVLRTEITVNDRRIVRQYMPLQDGGGLFVGPNLRTDNRMFYAPVDNIRVSSLFQPRRYHPVKHLRRAHEGMDFALPEGSNVYAAQSGTVLRIGRNRAAGRFIVLRHSSGYESYYNHMSAQNARLSAGSRVNAGDIIGKIGSTGYSTSPHLHFAVKKNGRFIDPVFLIRSYAYSQRAQVSRLIAKVTE